MTCTYCVLIQTQKARENNNIFSCQWQKKFNIVIWWKFLWFLPSPPSPLLFWRDKNLDILIIIIFSFILISRTFLSTSIREIDAGWRQTFTWASFGEKVKETTVVPLWLDIQCVTLSIQIHFLWCSRGTNKSRGRYEWLHKKVCESLKAPYFCISFVDLCLFFLNSHLNTNTISIFIIKYCKYGFFLFRHCIRRCPHRMVGVSSGIIMIFVLRRQH